jgi:tetratricopeptide (TPR) repeat protein
MKRLAILLLPLLMAPASSFAAERWTMARSPNFVIVGNASEAQFNAIANEFEAFRSAYTRLFPIRVSSTQTTIVVFRGDADLRQHVPLQNGKPFAGPAYVLREEDANHIVLTGGLADTSVVYHQFVRSLMTDSIGDLPLCFAEGFAEYYRSFKVLADNRRFQLGLPLRSHVTRLASPSQFMPLEKLFAVSMNSPEYNEQDRQGLFYAESWALTHYLIHGEGGKYQARIPDLIAALRNGKSPTQAVMDVLQLTTAKLEQQLRAYALKADSFSALEYVIPTALNTAAGMTTRVMSRRKPSFYRGDLLWRAQRMEEAEAHLRVAVSFDPNLGAAQSSLGRLLDMQAKRTEAIPFLKRGAELDPTNPLAHYYYASGIWNSALNSTIRPTPAERELARTEAMKAIELMPQFLQATGLVTRINLIGNENIGVTRTLLRNARQLFPSRDDLALLEALVLNRTAERESVPQLLRDVIARTPANSQVHREAERFLETVQLEATSRKTTLGNEATNTVTANGVITSLDCKNGWALSVSSNGNTLVFKAPNPLTVRFVVYSAAVRPPGCGSVPASGIPAIVTYRPPLPARRSARRCSWNYSVTSTALIGNGRSTVHFSPDSLRSKAAVSSRTSVRWPPRLLPRALPMA